MSTTEGATHLGQAWPNLGRRAANLLALVGFALLIVVGVLAALMAERVNGTADWVAHSLEVQGKAAGLLGDVQDLELAKRGYLLTRSDAFLPLYNGARAAIPQALAKLRSLVADNRDQTAQVERMESSVEDMLTTSAKAVELGRNGQFSEAAEIATTGRGQQILESFRAIVDDLEKAESDLLRERQGAEIDRARDHAGPGPHRPRMRRGSCARGVLHQRGLDSGIARAH